MNIEETKEVFENLIQKPVLTDQLLSRPPFKFILDIVSNTIKSTGYLKSEFTKEELQLAGNDKNTKIEFLEKLIKLLDSGDLGHVKATKIIGGKDPEDTNRLLQKLARNARNESTNSSKENKKVKNKDKEKSEKKSKKDISTSEVKKDGREKSRDRKDKEGDGKKKKSSGSVKEKEKEKEKSKEKRDKSKDKDKEKKEKKEKKKKEKLLIKSDSTTSKNVDASSAPVENAEPQDEGYVDQDGDDKSNVLLIDNTSSPRKLSNPQIQHLATSPIKTDDSGMGDDSPRPPPPAERAAFLRQTTGAARPQTSMGRPGTAASRPAPPKIKKKQIATFDNTPQPVIELKSEIITESSKNVENENDNFVVEEEEEDVINGPTSITELVDEENRGALVQKIMNTKAELEDATAGEVIEQADVDKNRTVEREKVRLLQNKLQDLTKSAYPLARMFDFASDDIESMIKELEKWRLEQRKNEQEDQNKKAAGFGDTSRLHDMIANLQREIKDIKDELSASRGRVLQNEDRIKVLVSNI